MLKGGRAHRDAPITLAHPPASGAAVRAHHDVVKPVSLAGPSASGAAPSTPQQTRPADEPGPARALRRRLPCPDESPRQAKSSRCVSVCEVGEPTGLEGSCCGVPAAPVHQSRHVPDGPKMQRVLQGKTAKARKAERSLARRQARQAFSSASASSNAAPRPACVGPAAALGAHPPLCNRAARPWGQQPASCSCSLWPEWVAKALKARVAVRTLSLTTASGEEIECRIGDPAARTWARPIGIVACSPLFTRSERLRAMSSRLLRSTEKPLCMLRCSTTCRQSMRSAGPSPAFRLTRRRTKRSTMRVA